MHNINFKIGFFLLLFTKLQAPPELDQQLRTSLAAEGFPEKEKGFSVPTLGELAALLEQKPVSNKLLILLVNYVIAEANTLATTANSTQNSENLTTLSEEIRILCAITKKLTQFTTQNPTLELDAKEGLLVRLADNRTIITGLLFKIKNRLVQLYQKLPHD